jgi:uncharacterized protein (TIGR03067 family)
MMKRCSVLLALILSCSAVRGQEQDSPLQGTWTLVQFERGGRKPPEELLKTKPLKMVIKEDTLRMSDGERGEGATFKIDRSRSPHEIDLVFKEGPNEDIERNALGIFELDGDNLKFAWRKDGGPRPKEFSSIPGERTSELIVLKREKGKP